MVRHVLLFLSVCGAALVSAVSATADPVRHFDTFVIDCGSHGLYEIVSKPGASQVVALDGAPSNSVAQLKDYELFLNGEFVDFTPGSQYQPPGYTNNHELVVCFDTTLTLPDYLMAFVLFTPARKG
jgi:hypothetical protein